MITGTAFPHLGQYSSVASNSSNVDWSFCFSLREEYLNGPDISIKHSPFCSIVIAVLYFTNGWKKCKWGMIVVSC